MGRRHATHLEFLRVELLVVAVSTLALARGLVLVGLSAAPRRPPVCVFVGWPKGRKIKRGASCVLIVVRAFSSIHQTSCFENNAVPLRVSSITYRISQDRSMLCFARPVFDAELVRKSLYVFVRLVCYKLCPPPPVCFASGVDTHVTSHATDAIYGLVTSLERHGRVNGRQ